MLFQFTDLARNACYFPICFSTVLYTAGRGRRRVENHLHSTTRSTWGGPRSPWAVQPGQGCAVPARSGSTGNWHQIAIKHSTSVHMFNFKLNFEWQKTFITFRSVLPFSPAGFQVCCVWRAWAWAAKNVASKEMIFKCQGNRFSLLHAHFFCWFRPYRLLLPLLQYDVVFLHCLLVGVLSERCRSVVAQERFVLARRNLHRLRQRWKRYSRHEVVRCVSIIANLSPLVADLIPGRWNAGADWLTADIKRKLASFEPEPCG